MSIINRVLKSDKLKPSSILKTVSANFGSNKTLLKWSENKETKNNFGDALNPWLFKKITGKLPANSNKVINISNKTVYSGIGSILDNNNTKNLVVWGSGFKEKGSKFEQTPKEILAVRGPLSRENIIAQGIECPEIYGDPALLLPKFYYPTVEKQYSLGIIAHYIDKANKNYVDLVESLPNSVLIIDIEDSIEEVVSNMLKCDKIASSSLHGIIVSDAYNIPSLQVKFSNKIVGDNFKFKDYMASVNREYKDPLEVNPNTSYNDLISSFYEYTFEFNSEKLLELCPFT